MSQQQMQFQLAYGTAETKSSCKSCHESIGDKHFMIGVKSESMFDPMWYHFDCFWTRCYYRKQMSRHLENFTELPGFETLNADDKEKLKEALMSNFGESENAPLKRKSESDDTPVDENNKKIKAVLPKLPSSAAEFLNKSGSHAGNGTTETQPSAERMTLLDESPAAPFSEQMDGIFIEVSKTSEGACVRIGEGVPSFGRFVDFNAQQWEALKAAFGQVEEAMGSVNKSEVISVDDNADIRVSSSNGTILITFLPTRSPRSDAGVTFTTAQWSDFLSRTTNVDAAIQSLLSK